MMKDAMAQLLLLLTALVHASQAPEECSGPTTEICATVGSNFTLPFRSSGCDPRCTWLRDCHDVCFCRDGYLHCEAGYKSRFKVSCENVTAEGDGSMIILSVQEGDGGLYCFPDSRHNSSCFNLVVKPNGTSRQVADLKNSTTLPNNTTDDPNKGWKTGVAVGFAIGLVVGFLLGALAFHFLKKKCPNQLVQDVHHDQRRNDVEMQRNGDNNEDDTQHQLMPQEG
ncbi:uncharacterized protein [Trachinotus anak]|uniref:uncharacterized protein n=1 Tax=Trachinotus anak TaxID=443729 RepID=UPI0039F17696